MRSIGERHLFDHTVQEIEGVRGRSPTVHAEHFVPTAVINGRVLVDAWPDLTEVHLDAITRQGAAIASRTLQTPPGTLEDLDAVTNKHAMDRVQ